MDGVIRASAGVFCAYIGFDAVSTAAGEAKNPQRDMPIGILGSLVFCTLLYIAMCAVLTGMVDFRLLGTAEPVSTALDYYPSLGWLQTLVELAAIRSEEHTSELQSLMRISYAVFCLKKKKAHYTTN